MKMAMPMVVLIIASLCMTGSAQQVPACGLKLIPCAPYLNSTTPPETCCGPLKDVLTTDLACLCSIFESPDILRTFKFDLNSALQLPKKCGVSSFSASVACGSAPAEAPGASIVPPATPGGDNSHSAASHGTAWLGLTGVLSMLLFWWSTLA